MSRKLKGKESKGPDIPSHSFDPPERAIIGNTFDGTIVSWNDSAERITGYPREDMIGQSIRSIIPDDQWTGYEQLLSRVREGNEISGQELIRLKRIDGFIDVSLSMSPVHDDNGDVIGATSAFYDITERKVLEEHLKQPGESFRLLASGSKIGIIVVQDGIIRFINPWSIESLGYSAERLISHPFADLVHPDDRYKFQDSPDLTGDHGKTSKNQNCRFIGKSGETLSVIVTSAPFTWEGRPATLNFIVDLTDRVKMEQDLQKAWEKSPDPMMILDRGKVIRRANESAQSLFQQSAIELIGKHFDIPGTLDTTEEVHIIDGIGEKVPVEVRAVRAEWEEQPGYLVFLKNISEKKQLETDLRNSEELYRRLISTMNDGAWFIDRNGSTTYVNTRMAELLGYTAEEMQGRPFFSFLDARYKKISKVWLQQRKQGIRDKSEFEMIRKDGTRVFSMVSTAPINNIADKFMGSIAIVVDITEKKRASDLIRMSEEKYRALAENSCDLIVRFDRDHKILYSNPAFSSVINVPTGSLIGRNFSELDMAPGIADDYNRAISKVFISGSDQVRQVQFPTHEKELVIDLRMIPELGEDGSVITVLSVARDITAMKQAENRIRHLASFTEANPNPVLEVDQQGGVLFSNVATELALRRAGADENPKLFIPKDFAGIVKEIMAGNRGLFYRELRINDRLFGENISFASQAGTIRIYVTDLTFTRIRHQE